MIIVLNESKEQILKGPLAIRLSSILTRNLYRLSHNISVLTFHQEVHYRLGFCRTARLAFKFANEVSS